LLAASLLSCFVAANANVVEFSEESLASLTLLDNTSYFNAVGLSFSQGTYYASDSRFIGAGVDDSGVTSADGDNVFEIDFLTPANSSYWTYAYYLILDGASMTMRFYDTNNSNVFTLSDSASGSNKTAYIGISGFGDISRIEVLGSDQRIGVGRVEFTPVPEPSTLAVLGIGGLALIRRRARK
jgi:hypothetical protein